MEQPQTKQLVSKLTLTLEPFQDITLVVVLKSPTVLRLINLMSLVKITQGKTYNIKQLDSGKRVIKEDCLQVVLCGRLENPIVHCNKALLDAQLNELVIPLAVRTD